MVPYWVRLARAGTTFIASASVNLGSGSGAPCNPLSFGAVGNGTTNDTNAIQNAIDTCASRGGGTVQLSALSSSTTYLIAPITLKSHIHLQVDEGVTLKGTNDHSSYVPAYINWVYQPNEALVSAKGATDVGVTGAGTIDGSGGQAQPSGDPSWWDLGRHNTSLPRPWLVEFYQCDHVTMSGVTLRNSPMWTQVFRFSNTIDASGLIINTTDSTAPNTDGVDVVGSTNVTLSNLNIAVGDDNIAIKSGLPIDPGDPRQQGLPAMTTSQIHISNITAGSGHGISIGSEAVNGVNNVTIQGVNYTRTGNGIRIKSSRNRGNQIYAITVSDLTMSHVSVPLTIDMYYMADVGPNNDPAHPTTSTTPFAHDITIRNLTATGANGQSIVQGLPESCVRNLILDNVSIQTSNLGLALRHVTGSFNNVTSTPGGSNPPVVVLENVHVATSGATPSIPATAPLTKQIACASQQRFNGPRREPSAGSM